MKLSENESDVVEASNLQLLQSLLNSIPKTLSFKGKWSLTGTKLSDLKTLISDLSDPPSTALSQTLSLSLACHTTNPPAGKRKTQNDVDFISAKIDDHINDCEVLIKSGVLHDGGVVSTTIVLRKEAIQVDSRSLITWLQIGSAESRN